MDVLKEQRVCVKFCFKLGKSFTETVQMLTQAFGDESMSKTRIYEWYNRFKKGRTSIEDDERSGRPTTAKTDKNIEKVRELIRSNRRLTVREVAEDVGISKTVCDEILTDDTTEAATFVARQVMALSSR